MKLHMDSYDGISFLNGLVFYAPVALLVRTQAGVSLSRFFILQALLSCTVFLGEIPAGNLTDRIGYRRTLIWSQLVQLSAKVFLFLAFIHKSYPLFLAEAVTEGIAACFASGTGSAYVYEIYGEEVFLKKSTRAANWGTVGFLVSTGTYAVLYAFWGIQGLLLAAICAGTAACICSVGLRKGDKETEGRSSGGDSHGRNTQSGIWRKLLKNSRFWVILLLTTCFSLGFLFINFFYADKMKVCGMDLKYLTPVILGYSCVQLLAEKLVGLVTEKNRGHFFGMALLLAGMGFILFGVARNRVFVLMLMLILPLFLDVPGFLLEKVENEFIDAQGAEERRATVLSVLNMGVNLLEIIMLLASAVFAGAGITLCFVLLGTVLLAAGLFLAAGREVSE